MKKRLAAMILAVGLGLFGLVGCSGGGGSNNPPASSEDPGEEEVMYIQVYNENGEIIGYGTPSHLVNNEDKTLYSFRVSTVDFVNVSESLIKFEKLDPMPYVKVILPGNYTIDENGNKIPVVVQEGYPTSFAYDAIDEEWSVSFGNIGGGGIGDEYLIWVDPRPTL